MSNMPIWMWLVLGFSGLVVVASVVLGNNEDMQNKLRKKMAKKAKKGEAKTSFNEDDLNQLQETAEDFLEVDTIERGMVSFKKDPNYFTMAFGVNGINLTMYNSQDRLVLKNGFMSILNSLKEDIQILVQSRYVELSKNFEYYKPVIENVKSERERLQEKIKDEKSEPVKKRMADKIQKLDQRNAYANHIIDFFNFYVKDSECIYIKIFIVVGYRYTGGAKWQKKKVADEAYNALINRVKILREQFESIKLKTYELDSIQTANIIYSTLDKNESSFAKLEDALKNGLLDMAVETLPGEAEHSVDQKYEKYDDDYEYSHMDEVAAAEDEEE